MGDAELSCRPLKSMILQFRRDHGAERLTEALQRAQLPPHLTLEFLEDPNNWTSFEHAQRVLDVLTEASGSSDFPRRAGMITASKDVLGFTYSLLKAFGNPRLCYRKTLEISELYNKVGAFSIGTESPSRITFSYASKVREPNRNFCEFRIGQFQSFPTIWGLKPARAVEHRCGALGHERCEYEFSWDQRPTRVFWAAGLLGGAALGSVAPWALDTPVSPWALASTAGLVGTLLGTIADDRRQLRQQRQLLAEQNEDVLRSMKDLQERFEEVRKLNETLEEKVHARTRDLQKASEDLQISLARQMELDRAKTQFFTNISHELRTPLTLILAPLETLMASGHAAKSWPEVETMYRNGLRLLKHINSLLDISRLDAHRERLKLEPTDVPEMLRSLVDASRGLATKKGIALEFREGPKVDPFPIDRDKVEKIFLNLLSNALHYTPAGTDRVARVEVRYQVDRQKFSFRVEDTGIGIPGDQIEKIFDRFHRVDNKLNGGYGGTGIGLALVRELAEFHMGRVSVTSSLGRGSTFAIELPMRADAYPVERIDRRQEQLDVPTDRRNPEELKKLRELVKDPSTLALAELSTADVETPTEPLDPNRPLVLVVDDNHDMLNYIGRVLAAEYRVSLAQDGEEAFRRAIQENPALIVSDMMMPRRNGQELLQDLRSEPRTRHIPVIFLTAKADLEAKIHGLEHGADDYLTKPFHFQELRARIRSLLNQRRLERELKEKNESLEKINLDLVLSKKDVFLQTIDAFAFAIEAKDPYTHGHSRRVSMLSESIARQLKLSEAEVERTRIAAILHDVGKIGMPESVLAKPGKLTPEEIKVIKLHPVLGYRILENVKELAPINQCILLHHERYDGRGYPEGKQAIDIPLPSRVIAVADTYDAMTSNRCYRKGLSHSVAVEEIIRCDGKQFDPDCVRAFLQLYQDRPPAFPEFPSALREFTEMLRQQALNAGEVPVSHEGHQHEGHVHLVEKAKS